jgi:hypothetical protein
VQDAGAVRRPERGQDTEAHLSGLRGRQRPVFDDHIAQRTVRNKLHHEPWLAVFLDDVVDGDHVRVAEPRGHLGFPQGATARDLPFPRVQQRGPDDLLDRDIAAQQLVACPPDDSHPAPADDGAKPVTPGKKAFWLGGIHISPITLSRLRLTM